MAIQGVLVASSLIVQHSAGNTASNPVPTHDLVLAALAVGIWALAIAGIAFWQRARERASARAHIRSMRFSRRDGHPFPRPFRAPKERTQVQSGTIGRQAAAFMGEIHGADVNIH